MMKTEFGSVSAAVNGKQRKILFPCYFDFARGLGKGIVKVSFFASLVYPQGDENVSSCNFVRPNRQKGRGLGGRNFCLFVRFGLAGLKKETGVTLAPPSCARIR